MKLRTLGVMLAASALAACGGSQEPAAEEAPLTASNTVNVYNWFNYIAEDTNANFEKATGVSVSYDVFDRNEVLEAKLLAGSSGYDVVVPTLNFLGRQIQTGVFLPLDRSKLPNLANLDPQMMRQIQKQDPGNRYAVPYMWGTTGIGYNTDQVKAAFGNTDITQSWDLVFKPENIAKLKDCGVTFLDTASEIVPIALNYLGEDPRSTDPEVIEKAAALLRSIRPSISQFHSSAYIEALANGDTCLVVGWSGDVIQARERADESGNGVNIAYSIPKEGAPLWFDMLAIPKDAKNLANAYAYINYLLDPRVMANNSNFINYPNAVPQAKALMDKRITDDPNIYPSPESAANLFSLAVLPPEAEQAYDRLWTDLKNDMR